MQKILVIMTCGLLVWTASRLEAMQRELTEESDSLAESDSDDAKSQASIADILLQEAYETESAYLKSIAVTRIRFSLDEMLNLGLYKNFTDALHDGDLQIVGQYLNIQSIRERLCKINKPLVLALIAILYQPSPQR